MVCGHRWFKCLCRNRVFVMLGLCDIVITYKYEINEFCYHETGGNTQVLYLAADSVTKRYFIGLVRRRLWDTLEVSIWKLRQEVSTESRRKHMQGKEYREHDIAISHVSSMQYICELLARSHLRTVCSIVSWLVPKFTSWRRQDEDWRRKHNSVMCFWI